MKPPEHTSDKPDTRGTPLNYSMYPPGRLPAWLLEKKTPARIQNYSMRSPSAPARIIPDYNSRKAEPAVEDTTIEPMPIEDEPMSLVRQIVVEANAPVDEDPSPVADDATPFVPESNAEGEIDNPEPVANDHTAPVEAPLAISGESESEAIVSEYTSQPQISQSAPPPPATAPPDPQNTPLPSPENTEPPTPPAGQKGYASQTARPSSNSFADWILNNSRIVLIILAVIILLPILFILFDMLFGT